MSFHFQLLRLALFLLACVSERICEHSLLLPPLLSLLSVSCSIFLYTIVLLLRLSVIIPVIQQSSHPAISVFVPFTHLSCTHSNIDFFFSRKNMQPPHSLRKVFIPPFKRHSFPMLPLSSSSSLLRRNFFRTLRKLAINNHYLSKVVVV